MSFHAQAHEPPSNRAFTSALTIAMGYFLGGFVPLLPYFFVDTVFVGLCISTAVMAVALFVFGYTKTCIVTGWYGSKCVREGIWGGLQMVVIGGVAAGAAMGLVMGFNRLSECGGSSLEGDGQL
jgi:VIT1/CCC1 family predicted Fe2+/Mn2+ transporter